MNYDATRRACYVGYVTQAIINNLPPLFFVIFSRDYGLDIARLGGLVLANFMLQLVVDLLAVRYVDRIGYRPSIVFAQLMASLGLIALAVLPQLMANTYLALLIALAMNAIGGGLIEVLISPITNMLPGEGKASRMAFLHSFYCWGHMAVVILTTLLLLGLGEGRWFLIPLVWMLVPLGGALAFTRVPIIEPRDEGSHMPPLRLLRRAGFWLMLLMMLAAGAAEQVIAQWSSFFAETGLGISKVAGDLAGPTLFALMMGIGRYVTGRLGTQLRIRRTLRIGAVTLMLGYLLTVFAPLPALSLAGCAIAGLGVSVMWPGVLSLADRRFPAGGTGLFGFLAVFGDLGCALGPWIMGLVSAGLLGRAGTAATAARVGLTAPDFALRAGILVGIVFPIVLFLGTLSRGEPRRRDEPRA